MGYLFFAISRFGMLVRGYCGKKSSALIDGFKDATSANVLRMTLCVLMGVAILLVNGDISGLAASRDTILIGAVCGISTAVGVIVWMVSLKYRAYMLMDVFGSVGVVVPLIFGQILFHESISLVQWFGYLLIIIAAWVMMSYNTSIKGTMSTGAFIILVLHGLSSGIIELCQKMFAMSNSGDSISVFNIYTYFFAGIILFVLYFIFKRNSPREQTEKSHIIPKGVFKYIFIMSVALFGASYFNTKAAELLSSVQLFPLNQGAMLVCSSLMASIFFKEKITHKCVIGIIMVFMGLIIINFAK